jgi:prepilin-type N-terminal cleavage/methylation domain-containing protein
MNKKKGFTLLELIVSIFLIAIVLGTALLLMAANLNVLDKANDILIANALSQYTIEDVRNIEFPPVYYDRQDQFGDRPLKDANNYKEPEEIDPVNDDDVDWTPEPAEFQKKYIIRRYDFRYDEDGLQILPTDLDIIKKTVKHRVDVYVLRKKDNYVILQDSVTISRDGLF